MITKLQNQNSLQKEDLEILFNLYGVYDCIDFECPVVIQENYGKTTESICTFVANCCYDTKKLNSECKSWMIDLFKNYKESPYKEDNFGLGHFNLDLTTILDKFVYKDQVESQKADENLKEIIAVVLKDWQPQLEKFQKRKAENEKLNNWYKATAALHNAIYN